MTRWLHTSILHPPCSRELYGYQNKGNKGGEGREGGEGGSGGSTFTRAALRTSWGVSVSPRVGHPFGGFDWTEEMLI